MDFTAEKITDQKRYARGEQLKFAQTLLRVRDHAHNRKWRALILAGGAPQGEINAIRELMPAAHITAVDIEQDCVEAAVRAGADYVVRCDLADLATKTLAYGSTAKAPNTAFAGLDKFDLVHLDFCSNLGPDLRRIVNVYRSLVTGRGIYIVSFSYGRDVTEVFKLESDINRSVLGAEVPDAVAIRVAWLFRTQQWSIRSIITYRGAAMPMCSVLCQVGWQQGLNSKLQEDRYRDDCVAASYASLLPGDFELAVTMPDPSKLYDCPQERIESLRRSHTAIMASYTRNTRRSAADQELRP